MYYSERNADKYIYIHEQVSLFFSAMIDSLGGPKQVNNMLATLNLKSISDSNLK